MSSFLALDVGGTAVKTAIVNDKGEFLSKICNYPSNSNGTSEEIIENLANIINKTLALAKDGEISGISIGFPGPFDYENGISLMQNLNKYDSIYKLPLKQELLSRINTWVAMRFANDADLYCLGESTFGVGKGYKRILCVCLGTGLGAGFFAEGRLVKAGNSVPENGWIYHTPYKESIADHYLSATGLRKMIKASPLSGSVPDVKELCDMARGGNQTAVSLLDDFSKMLAEGVTPHAIKFNADCVIIGGDVGKSLDLFDKSLAFELKAHDITLLQSKEFSNNTLLAAPLLFIE